MGPLAEVRWGGDRVTMLCDPPGVRGKVEWGSLLPSLAPIWGARGEVGGAGEAPQSPIPGSL